MEVKGGQKYQTGEVANMILKVNARPPHVVGLCFFVFPAANEVFVEPIETQDLEEFAQFLRDLFPIISELRRNVYSSCDTQILEQMYSRSFTPDNGSRLSGTATSGLEGRVPQLQIKLLTQLQKAFCFLLFWILSRLFP